MFALIDRSTTCTFEQIDGRFAPSPFLHPRTSLVLARTPSHPLVCLRLLRILSIHTARFCTSIRHLVQHSFFLSHFLHLSSLRVALWPPAQLAVNLKHGGASSNTLACVSLVGRRHRGEGKEDVAWRGHSLRTQCSVGQKVGQNYRAPAKGPAVILAGVCRLCHPKRRADGGRRINRKQPENPQGTRRQTHKLLATLRQRAGSVLLSPRWILLSLGRVSDFVSALRARSVGQCEQVIRRPPKELVWGKPPRQGQLVVLLFRPAPLAPSTQRRHTRTTLA